MSKIYDVNPVEARDIAGKYFVGEKNIIAYPFLPQVALTPNGYYTESDSLQSQYLALQLFQNAGLPVAKKSQLVDFVRTLLKSKTALRIFRELDRFDSDAGVRNKTSVLAVLDEKEKHPRFGLDRIASRLYDSAYVRIGKQPSKPTIALYTDRASLDKEFTQTWIEDSGLHCLDDWIGHLLGHEIAIDERAPNSYDMTVAAFLRSFQVDLRNISARNGKFFRQELVEAFKAMMIQGTEQNTRSQAMTMVSIGSGPRSSYHVVAFNLPEFYQGVKKAVEYSLKLFRSYKKYVVEEGKPGGNLFEQLEKYADLLKVFTTIEGKGDYIQFWSKEAKLVKDLRADERLREVMTKFGADEWNLPFLTENRVVTRLAFYLPYFHLAGITAFSIRKHGDASYFRPEITETLKGEEIPTNEAFRANLDAKRSPFYGMEH